MKLIDKDAVLAEIDRIENGLMDAQGNFAYREDEGAYHTLCSLENFINSLEVKEVDIEIEVTRFVTLDPILSKLVNYEEAMLIAKHFFELGLNASNPLTWEDIKLIWNITDEMDNMPEEEFYKEVLKRFKAQKGE